MEVDSGADNSRFVARERTKTHPHGTCVCNENETFAFLRISKCASSSVVSYLRLKKTLPITNLKADTPFWASIRNPRERLMSSIPESLLRCTPNAQIYPGNVLVSDQIYTQICALEYSNEKELAIGFLNLVREHGHFDAHHEPMVNFLFDENGHSEGNPRIYDSADTSFVIPQLARDLNLSSLANWRLNSNSRSDSGARRRTRNLRWAARVLVRERRLPMKRYGTNHPVLRLSRRIEKVSDQYSAKVLQSFYSTIRTDPDVLDSIDSIVRTDYRGDDELFENLQSSQKQGESFPRLKSLI